MKEITFRDLLFFISMSLSFWWLGNLYLSDKEIDVKMCLKFAGMLALLGVTCYISLNY